MTSWPRNSFLQSFVPWTANCFVFTGAQGFLTSQYSDWIRTGRPEFEPRQGQRIFPVACASRPAVGPSQPLIRWVPGIVFPEVKCSRGVMLTTHPLLVPKSRTSGSYTSCPPSASSACSGIAFTGTFESSSTVKGHSEMVVICYVFRRFWFENLPGESF
jgi:hypothetical protein